MNVKFPAAVGVPEIVDPVSDTPEGKDPSAIAQVYAPTPPVAAKDCEYAVPVVPPGSEAVVTERAVPATEIVNCFDPERDAVSVAVTVNVDDTFDVDVGVPEIVDPTNDNPAGNEPWVMVHVREPEPPAPTKLCE